MSYRIDCLRVCVCLCVIHQLFICMFVADIPQQLNFSPSFLILLLDNSFLFSSKKQFHSVSAPLETGVQLLLHHKCLQVWPGLQCLHKVQEYLTRIKYMSMCTFVYSLAAKYQQHTSPSSERRNHDQSQTKMSPCVPSLKLTFNNTD